MRKEFRVLKQAFSILGAVESTEAGFMGVWLIVSMIDIGVTLIMSPKLVRSSSLALIVYGIHRESEVDKSHA